MFTEPTNLTQPYELLIYANSVTGNLFIPLICLIFWVILFVSSKQALPLNSRAFTFSSFVVSILGVMFWWMGVMDLFWVYVAIIMTMAGYAWMYYEERAAFE